MKSTFQKREKLKSEKLIALLFEEGSTISEFPIRLFFLKTKFNDDARFKTAVSVSKRSFKSAVKRNRIKRLLREAYRLNKSHYFNNSKGQYALMILYLGKDMPDFNLINTKLKLLFGKFSTIIAEEIK